MTKQVILDLDDATARELEAVAPSRKRKRSEFLRHALRSALDRRAEARMREAYLEQPDNAEPIYLDPAAWEPVPVRRRRGRPR